MKKRKWFLVCTCAMLAVSLTAGAITLPAKAATTSSGRLTDIFKTEGFASALNVSGDTLQNENNDVLFPDEDKTGIQLETTSVGTATFRSGGVFETDFRVWSSQNGSASANGALRPDSAADVEEISFTFDDEENTFTLHCDPYSVWATGSPEYSVSINGGEDQYAYYYRQVDYKNIVQEEPVFNNYRACCAPDNGGGYGTTGFGTTFTNHVNISPLGVSDTTNRVSAGGSVSTKLGFDPENLEVYTYAYNVNTKKFYKTTIWKLDDGLKVTSFAGNAPKSSVRSLTEFGDVYSVTMTVKAYSGRTAKMLVYSVNGYSMASSDGKISGESEPKLQAFQNSGKTYETGTEFELPVPKVYDFLNPNAAFNGTVTAKKDGQSVAISGVGENDAWKDGAKITLETGKYEFTYTLKDGDDVFGEEKFLLTAQEIGKFYSKNHFSDIFDLENATVSDLHVAENTLTDKSGSVLFPTSEKVGALIEATQDATIGFKSKTSGVFEMSARVFAENTVPANNRLLGKDYDGYELTEMVFTFDDGTVCFDVVVKAGAPLWNASVPTAFVRFSDSEDLYSFKYNSSSGVLADYRMNSYGTWLVGSSFTNRSYSYDASWVNSNDTLPLTIGFDPVALTVYGYGLQYSTGNVVKYTIWNLAQRQTNYAGTDKALSISEKQPLITSFGSTYNVTIGLKVAQGKTARLLVHSVGNQVMETNEDGRVKNSEGPSLSKKILLLNGTQNEEYVLPVAKYTDRLDGEQVVVKASVKAPDGTDVALSNLAADGSITATTSFIPTASGMYTVAYYAVDKQGVFSEETTLELIVEEKTDDSSMGGGNVSLPENTDPPTPPQGEIEEPDSVAPETPAGGNGEIVNKKKGCGGVIGLSVPLTLATLAFAFYVKKRKS